MCPGLYTHRLAWAGNTVHGIDFSPASIAYARQVAESEGLACAYTLGDVRTTIEFFPSLTGEEDKEQNPGFLFAITAQK